MITIASRTCHIFGGNAVVDIVVVSEQVLLLAGERGRAVLRLSVLVLVPGPRSTRLFYSLHGSSRHARIQKSG